MTSPIDRHRLSGTTPPQSSSLHPMQLQHHHRLSGSVGAATRRGSGSTTPQHSSAPVDFDAMLGELQGAQDSLANKAHTSSNTKPPQPALSPAHVPIGAPPLPPTFLPFMNQPAGFNGPPVIGIPVYPGYRSVTAPTPHDQPPYGFFYRPPPVPLQVSVAGYSAQQIPSQQQSKPVNVRRGSGMDVSAPSTPTSLPKESPWARRVYEDVNEDEVVIEYDDSEDDDDGDEEDDDEDDEDDYDYDDEPQQLNLRNVAEWPQDDRNNEDEDDQYDDHATVAPSRFAGTESTSGPEDVEVPDAIQDYEAIPSSQAHQHKPIVPQNPQTTGQDDDDDFAYPDSSSYSRPSQPRYNRAKRSIVVAQKAFTNRLAQPVPQPVSVRTVKPSNLPAADEGDEDEDRPLAYSLSRPAKKAPVPIPQTTKSKPHTTQQGFDLTDDDESNGDKTNSYKQQSHLLSPSLDNPTIESLEKTLDKYLRKSKYMSMISGVNHAPLDFESPSHWASLVKAALGSSVDTNSKEFSELPGITGRSSMDGPAGRLSLEKHPIADDDSDGDEVPLMVTLARRKKSAAAVEQVTPAIPQSAAASHIHNDKENINILISKLKEVNEKKVTTRIFLEDDKQFKTVSLTPLMTADQVVSMVLKRHALEMSHDWTLFEVCNEIGFERPLRDWETVVDVIGAWDLNSTVNALVMKRYPQRGTLLAKSIVGKFPKVQGHLYLELKPGKWQKKLCVIRDGSMYYYREPDVASETLLCRLTTFDVYTAIPKVKRKKKAPTASVMCFRSTQNVKHFENRQDHVKYACTDKSEKLYEWILAARVSRSEATFKGFPEVFEDYPDVPARHVSQTHSPTQPAESASGPLIQFDEEKSRSRARTTNEQPLRKRKESAHQITPTLATKDISPAPTPPILSPQAPAGPIKGPLLSFPDSKINYQVPVSATSHLNPTPDPPAKKSLLSSSPNQKDHSLLSLQAARQQHRELASTRSVKSETTTEASAQPQETQQQRDERRERERKQYLDALWEYEQSECERLVMEARVERQMLQSDDNNNEEAVGESNQLASSLAAIQDARKQRERERELQGMVRGGTRPSTGTEGRVAMWAYQQSLAAKQRQEANSTAASNPVAPTTEGQDAQSVKRKASKKSKKKETLLDNSTSPKAQSSPRKLKVKPLVDVSDSKNCLTCGCSEHRPGARGVCSNCYHVHKPA